LSYDTHWFCQALDVFTSERPSLNRLTRAFAIITYPLSDFSRLQGLDQAPSPGWEPGHSLGFFPFQRYHHIDATKEAPASNAPRSQVFTTSQQVPWRQPWLTGLFHPVSTRRVRTFRASPRNDRKLFPATLLLRCYLPPMDSFHFPMRTPAYITTEDYPYLRYSQKMAL
jgi:hypothetical protein